MTKLHTDLLLALRAAGDYGLDVATVLADLRLQRHRSLAEPQLKQALRDLADKSLVTEFTSVLEQRRWRITGLGVSALQEAGA